jgi:hypothetical protein
MKKLSVIVIVAALVALGLSGAAYAFHGGGVASCESCHTMHNSKDGAVMSRTTTTTGVQAASLAVGQAGVFLLQGTDQSSTCLNCHGALNKLTAGSYTVLSYGAAVQIPSQRSPGGDFGWLRKGSKKGHSIVAVDYLLTAETTKAGNVAPGGTYPVGSLHCSSCHDPHGKYRRLSTDPAGNYVTSGEAIAGSGSYGADPTNGEAVGAYRILGGMGYLPKSMEAFPALAISAQPMMAAAPSTYNATEAATEVIVNYGDSSAGAWCASCHPKMHNSSANGTGITVHPNDAAMTLFNIYNSYSSSGKTGGSFAGYTSLIPVAYDNIKQNSLLNGHFTKGAAITGSDRVMCLSCHRAHASGIDYMLRFPSVEEMVLDDPTGLPTYAKGGTSTSISTVSGLSPQELQAALYDRPASVWGAGQRTLCNKCHAKD